MVLQFRPAQYVPNYNPGFLFKNSGVGWIFDDQRTCLLQKLSNSRTAIFEEMVKRFLPVLVFQAPRARGRSR